MTGVEKLRAALGQKAARQGHSVAGLMGLVYCASSDECAGVLPTFQGVIKHFDFFLPPICKFARLGVILIEKMPIYIVIYISFFCAKNGCVEQVCQPASSAGR